MFPAFTRQDTLQLSATNIVLLPQNLLLGSGLSQSKNLLNLVWSQFRPTVALPNCMLVISAAFIVHISYVIRLSTEKQMLGVEAGGVVTLVQYLEGVAKVESKVERCADPVDALTLGRVSNGAVTSSVPATRVFPTALVRDVTPHQQPWLYRLFGECPSLVVGCVTFCKWHITTNTSMKFDEA